MKVEAWPNKLGDTVTTRGNVFEVSRDALAGGGALRCNPDNSLTGQTPTHWKQFPVDVDPSAVVASWKNDRKSWKECGDY
jgi:hypothetical protein